MTEQARPWNQISTEALEQARAAVRPLAERLELARRLDAYAPQRWDGSPPDGPVLRLDDFSGIPFLVGVTGVEEYQHRARLRCRSGDLYAAVTPTTAGYEEYCQQRLRLEPAALLQVEPGDNHLALARGCATGDPWRRLVEVAREAGGLTVEPFMGIEEVWELGHAIGGEAEVPVTVVAPPPPTTWIANDKAAFAEVVREVLGEEWLVETYSEGDARGLSRRLLELACRHSQVGLKRTRCASAMGNAVFSSHLLLGMSPDAVEEEVEAFLERTEWQGNEEVQAVAWEKTDLSPSVQLWIPPRGAGEPHADGIFEQILAGERRVFVGSRTSTLPETLHDALARGSLRVAAALQEMGYVGRCSFDFLVVGEPEEECRKLFTECNGRWGGTSMPMSFLDRLLPSPRPPYRAQDFVHPDLVGVRVHRDFGSGWRGSLRCHQRARPVHLLQHRSAGPPRQARRHCHGRHPGRGRGCHGGAATPAARTLIHGLPGAQGLGRGTPGGSCSGREESPLGFPCLIPQCRPTPPNDPERRPSLSPRRFETKLP